MKSPTTWFPLYVGDYLADTVHLSTEQHGAYLLLLMAAWKRSGALPADDAQLAAITRLPPTRWRAVKGVILAFFDVSVDGSVYLHKRVTAELERARANRDAKARAGAKGAANRWQRDGTAIDSPLANASRADAPSPSPSPSEIPSGSSIESTIVDSSTAKPSTIPICPHRQILSLYAECLPTLSQPRLELWEQSSSAKDLRARWRWLLTAKRDTGDRYATTQAEGLEWFRRFFETVAASDFLTGRTERRFNATLHWLVKSANFEKVVGGNYANRGAA